MQKLDRWSLETFFKRDIFKYVSFTFVLLFRWFCSSKTPLTYVTEDVKVILESIHLILTLFNLLEKLLLKRRQCSIFSEIISVCHMPQKTFYSWFNSRGFFLSFIDSSITCSWRAHSVLLGPGDAVVDGETESPPSGAHIRRDERSEVIWTANIVYVFGHHFVFPKTSEMKMVCYNELYYFCIF